MGPDKLPGPWQAKLVAAVPFVVIEILVVAVGSETSAWFRHYGKIVLLVVAVLYWPPVIMWFERRYGDSRSRVRMDGPRAARIAPRPARNRRHRPGGPRPRRRRVHR